MYERNFVILIFLVICGTVVYCSFAEWLLHRFVMHKPLLGFRYPFRAHTLTHHHIFKSDESYHLKHAEDKETIPMAWWNGPVLCILGTLPSIPLSIFLAWHISPLMFLTTFVYYGVYEYIHWCMHLPKARRVERSRLFFRLNGHHLLHHRYMNQNFNVVLPLADLCLGTLLTRSKISFAQPEGPMIPDVQPRRP